MRRTCLTCGWASNLRGTFRSGYWVTCHYPFAFEYSCRAKGDCDFWTDKEMLDVESRLVRGEIK
jgi:hypothetical protein